MTASIKRDCARVGALGVLLLSTILVAGSQGWAAIEVKGSESLGGGVSGASEPGRSPGRIDDTPPPTPSTEYSWQVIDDQHPAKGPPVPPVLFGLGIDRADMQQEAQLRIFKMSQTTQLGTDAQLGALIRRRQSLDAIDLVRRHKIRYSPLPSDSGDVEEEPSMVQAQPSIFQAPSPELSAAMHEMVERLLKENPALVDIVHGNLTPAIAEDPANRAVGRRYQGWTTRDFALELLKPQGVATDERDLKQKIHQLEMQDLRWRQAVDLGRHRARRQD